MSRDVMAGGALRARVVLQRETQQAPVGGSYEAAWEDVATLWARIEPVSGREALQGARRESRVTHRALLRYRTDAAAGMRLIWGDRIFRIQAVMHLGMQRRFSQFLVTEGGAA